MLQRETDCIKDLIFKSDKAEKLEGKQLGNFCYCHTAPSRLPCPHSPLLLIEQEQEVCHDLQQ